MLVAPPGAGKTTRVPLALLPGIPGRILMLEPRRLAARAAAPQRLAETAWAKPLGQPRRLPHARRKSVPGTRIEVVTERHPDPDAPIRTRALDGIGCVIFDEFHERSLNADLGAGPCCGGAGRAASRSCGCVVMSATLDAEPVAALLDGAPLITRSDGPRLSGRDPLAGPPAARRRRI
ncbi:hypothetical protein PE067_14460 [Paracoccus sp. DMF-8]|uniref:hypothetical protein n=1 Tax=Paracoccus sp. DMF-8 TaxID=3019445 RepID=UPI0023E3F25F|nr:hypothetical protein [Paracoccus sp. DMF-8]MDF3607221.1 hypothetical protein [Paracoccus sp. DMF-8]